MEILHLDYSPTSKVLVLPLQSRLQGSASPVLRERYSRWSEVGLAELGMAVSTRFTIAFIVARRLGKLLQDLRDEIVASGKLNELLDGGYVYTPVDPMSLYEICGAVDAFFFEYRSCYEVIGKFICGFGKHILDRKISEEELIKALVDTGAKTHWIDPLRLNRILFFHNTAPWIALKVNKRDPFECSLIIMKRNLETFNNPDDYVVQPEIVETIEGFQVATWQLRDWLLKQIGDTERKLLAKQT
jgi:hypothetical protein